MFVPVGPLMPTTFCVSIPVRAAPATFRRKEWSRLIRDDAGKLIAPEAAHNAFMDFLQAGIFYVPVGKRCDRFDNKISCLGHHAPEITTTKEESAEPT